MLTLNGIKATATNSDSTAQSPLPAAVQATLPRLDSSQLSRPLLQEAAQRRQQSEQVTLSSAAGDIPSDSVRVSSTLGKAASSGVLSREDALAIYKKIAEML